MIAKVYRSIIENLIIIYAQDDYTRIGKCRIFIFTGTY